jgi:CBS domain-containing protein
MSGGYGKVRESMRAQEVMSCPVVTVRRETSLAEVARIMADRRIGCVPVVDKHGKLCGVITQTDFSADEHGVPFSTEALLQMFSRVVPPEATQRAREVLRTATAEKVMTTEIITGEEDTPAEEMARQMLRYDIDHIPVLRDGVPIGIVARHDFLRMIAEETKLE